MKNLLFTCLMALAAMGASAQTIKPCDKWLTGYIEVVPKMLDGMRIDNYVTGKLQSDTSLKAEEDCLVGVEMWVNCKGEFSFVRMQNRNKTSMTTKCATLQKELEKIIRQIKSFAPGSIGTEKKDLNFKVVVKIKENGKPVAELLF